jgi:hypothetical protein
MSKNQKESEEENLENRDSLIGEEPELCMYEALHYLNLDDQEPYPDVKPSPPSEKPSETSKEIPSK